MMILVVVLFFVLMTKSCKSTENFANSGSACGGACKNKYSGSNRKETCCIAKCQFPNNQEFIKRGCQDMDQDPSQVSVPTVSELNTAQTNLNSGSTNTGSTNTGSTNTGSTNTGSTNNSCTPRCLNKEEVLKIPQNERWPKLDLGSCGSNACKKGPDGINYSNYGENVAPHCQKKYNPCLLTSGTTNTANSVSTSNSGQTNSYSLNNLKGMSLSQLCSQLNN